MPFGGLRTKNISKHSIINKPLLTVITIVRNGDQFLEQTILSVINQQYTNIEYIIIDGGSIDTTLDIIKKYENKIDYWISEKDNGIYDAFNKGIKLSTGDWINFMNAGDKFVNNDICKSVINEIITKKFDIIYGDYVAKNIENNSEIYVKAKLLDKIWKGMIFSHQSSFIKLHLLKENLFNLNFKIAADYNQILSLYLKNKIFYYLPLVFAKTQIGGVSYSNYRTILEQIKIIHSHKPFSLKLFYSIYPLILSIVTFLMGKRITNFIRHFKWKLIYYKT